MLSCKNGLKCNQAEKFFQIPAVDLIENNFSLELLTTCVKSIMCGEQDFGILSFYTPSDKDKRRYQIWQTTTREK